MLYSTKDFVTAVVLRLVGFDLVKLKRDDGITTFSYRKKSSGVKDDIEEILRKYWDKELVYPVRDVLETEKELKTRIHTLPQNLTKGSKVS